MKPSDLDALLEAAPMFAALGDPTRLQLVVRISEDGPMPIVALTQGMGMSRQAVTKHLDALQEVGLLRSVRSGRQRLWELEPTGVGRVRRHLDAISRQWDAAIDRLKAFVED